MSLSRHAPRLAGLALACALVFGADAAAAPEPPSTVETISGQKVALGGEGAAPVELIFVASWCEECEKALAAARRRLAELRQSGHRVLLVGVAQRQDADAFASWARGFGFLDDAVVFDADGTLEKTYGVELLPWFVVHAADKGVVHEGSRSPTVERLRTWIGE